MALDNPNLFLALTEGSAPFTVPDQGAASIVDAAGPQTINVASGGSMALSGQSGTNNINIEADAASFEVAINADLDVVLTGPNDEEIVLGAPSEPQALVFGDGATTLQLNAQDQIVIGDQVVGADQTAATAIDTDQAIADPSTTSAPAFDGTQASAAQTAAPDPTTDPTVGVTGVAAASTAPGPGADIA